MSCNQQSSWHHTCQDRDIVSATPAPLELVPERTSSNLELCTAEAGRTQEELLWYRRMYENIPSVYFSLDLGGKILSVNQFGADCLGYAPEELIQKPVFDLFARSDQPRLSDALTGLLRGSSTNEVANWEFRLDCATSKILWVKVVARILPGGEPHPVILMICEDITAYKTAAQAQLEEMESLNRFKEEFLGTVSYELRTPLTNMKMAIQMLLIALNKEQFSSSIAPQAEPSKVARYLQILNNECDREINLITNFLDLQRLDTSVKPLVLETIQVQEWLVRVLELFNARNRNSCQYQLHLKVDPNLPSLVCDPFSLERIVIELLTNACKFSPTGEKIIVTAQLKSHNIQLQVINSGVEIPVAELPRIFDKFYRIPSNDPCKQGGTGLGLALVQKLTKYLGGTIEVESGSNLTCFTIQLPLLREG